MKQFVHIKILQIVEIWLLWVIFFYFLFFYRVFFEVALIPTVSLETLEGILKWPKIMCNVSNVVNNYI